MQKKISCVLNKNITNQHVSVPCKYISHISLCDGTVYSNNLFKKDEITRHYVVLFDKCGMLNTVQNPFCSIYPVCP